MKKSILTPKSDAPFISLCTNFPIIPIQIRQLSKLRCITIQADALMAVGKIGTKLLRPHYSNTPTYTWNAVLGSTWYYLWVNDSTGIKIQQWYTAAVAGCLTGTGTCSVTPATALAQGGGMWWIQTWNPVGYSPWSSGISFSAS